jgi:hypothetical protein
MLSYSAIKRKVVVTPSSVVSTQHQRPRLNYETPIRSPDLVKSATQSIFVFSPFGLCCKVCKKKVKIQLDKQSISEHLKKHGMDSRLASVRSMLENFTSQCDAARVSGSIDIFRSDNKTYQGYACLCGHVFSRKDNAMRHCKQKGCDSKKLGNVELFKLSPLMPARSTIVDPFTRIMLCHTAALYRSFSKVVCSWDTSPFDAVLRAGRKTAFNLPRLKMRTDEFRLSSYHV